MTGQASKRSENSTLGGHTNEHGMLEKKSAGPDAAIGDEALWPDDSDARRKVLIATLECWSPFYFAGSEGGS